MEYVEVVEIACFGLMLSSEYLRCPFPRDC